MMSKKPTRKTPAQQGYADKKAKLTELQKAVNKAAADAGKDWLIRNPDCNDLAVKPMNIAYVRRKGATTKVITEIASRMMNPANKDKTQAEILRDIQPQFPEITLHANLWQNELSPGLWRKVEAIVQNGLRKPVSLRGCKTLSKIRKKVQAAQQVAAGARTFKTEITFTNARTVIIGNKSYPIVMRGSEGAEYPCIRINVKDKGRCWLRVDALAAALLEE